MGYQAKDPYALYRGALASGNLSGDSGAMLSGMEGSAMGEPRGAIGEQILARKQAGAPATETAGASPYALAGYGLKGAGVIKNWIDEEEAKQQAEQQRKLEEKLMKRNWRNEETDRSRATADYNTASNVGDLNFLAMLRRGNLGNDRGLYNLQR